jgi:hypothetical protein
MAAQAEIEDPLYNLRLSIKQGEIPTLTTSADPTAADTVTDLALATHISFNVGDAHRTFSITSPTRFEPDNKPIDLRSCYFAWLNKDASVTDYFAAVQTLNEELPSGAGGSVQNLTFAQKIELIAWLSGETESSDSIAAIDSGAASAAAGDAAAIAGGQGVPIDRDMKRTGGGKLVDARLLQIYDGERRMGDHNTVLRGSKNVVRYSTLPTVYSQTNNKFLGLLTLPHHCPKIPARPPLGRKNRSRSAPSRPRIQPPKARPKAARTHHSALAQRLFAPAHRKHQAIPRRRRLHPRRYVLRWQ